MEISHPPGKIILLNGASSSGKTELSRALQNALADPFWHISIDHLRDSGVLPLARIRTGEFDWPSLRPAFFDGFHRCLPAWAQAGNNLVVEHIIETEPWLHQLAELLSPFDVFTVSVHCPLAELERREKERGDRRAGEARRDFESIHQFAVHDLEIDTTASLESNVESVVSAWSKRSRHSALARLANLRENERAAARRASSGP